MTCFSKSASGSALLLEHAAGHLRGAEAARVAAHLRLCESCAAQVAQQSQLWSLLDVWDAPPVSASFNRSLYAQIERESRGSLWHICGEILNRWVARPALPLAAFSLLIVAGLYLERPQAPLTATPTAVQAPAVVTPTDADQLNKALDDLQMLHQLDLVKDEATEASHGM